MWCIGRQSKHRDVHSATLAHAYIYGFHAGMCTPVMSRNDAFQAMGTTQEANNLPSSMLITSTPHTCVGRVFIPTLKQVYLKEVLQVQFAFKGLMIH